MSGSGIVISQVTTEQRRRYDLDWLRIGLFLLLILYHVGMFYVPWQWHVKSFHAPVEWLELPMQIMNPWRIPALFIISGIALRFALDKATSHGVFLWRRFFRLLLPVLFGMAVVCAPQAYLELKEDGVETGDFLQFYLNYLKPPWASPEQWTTITPTWNHLWYVVYILLLSVTIIAVSALLRGRLQGGFDRFLDWCSERAIVFLLGPMFVSFIILWWFQESVDAVQMVWGDWHRLVNSLWLMLFGFAIAKHKGAWSVLWRFRWVLLGIALVLGLIRTMDIMQWIWSDSKYDAMYYITRSFYSWAVMLSLFAFGQMLSRGPDKVRQYLSDAVFPYYMLHQTVIIVLGVWLSRSALSFGVEFALLIVGTGLVTAMFYHFVVRNMGKAALLLGGKPIT